MTLLIEKWDNDHSPFFDVDPNQLLTSLMAENGMKAEDLVDLLATSKGYVSEILHYKKGMSKHVIRKLSLHFKISQEAFNRPYNLKAIVRLRLKTSARRSVKQQPVHT